MSVQVVQDQSYSHRIWVAFVEHTLDPPRPVLSRSMLGGLHVTFTRQLFQLKENLDNAITDIWGFNPFWPSRRAGNGLMHLPDELLAGFTLTDLRMSAS